MKAHTPSTEIDMTLVNNRSLQGRQRMTNFKFQAGLFWKTAKGRMVSWNWLLINVIVRVCTGVIVIDEMLPDEPKAMIVETFEHTEDFANYKEFFQK